MLKVLKLNSKATIPTVAHPGEDLAFDLYALNDTLIHPSSPTVIETGVAATFDMTDIRKDGPKYGLLIRDRSSMAKNGLTVSGGVIDAGYRGEIKVILTSSWATTTYLVRAGDKIAQMIPLPVLTGKGVQEVESLDDSDRGAAGFGSTGK
jgi:dUTP pyrophosphatase